MWLYLDWWKDVVEGVNYENTIIVRNARNPNTFPVLLKTFSFALLLVPGLPGIKREYGVNP